MLIWISPPSTETLTATTRAEAHEPRTKNPLRAILLLDDPAMRRANAVAFIFSLAFVTMETSLTFLAAERFGYTARQNGYLLGFLGLCAIVTQGWLVRKLLKTQPETKVLSTGLLASALGLVVIGFALQPWLLYVGLALLALGSGLVNPASTGLISLYASAAEQGRILGIFRSLGSLSRAITPILAGTAFWMFGSRALFVSAAILSAVAWALSKRLPQPVK